MLALALGPLVRRVRRQLGDDLKTYVRHGLRIPSARSRAAMYALVIVAAGGWVCFHRLGSGMVIDDEASFAYTTDYMRTSGDWVVPRIDAAHAHLNATPLYNWLSCLTWDWFGDGELRYRVWAAAFGLACGLAVMVLGTLLFRPEVGLLAALTLLTNHHFLFWHGVREGVMEPGLAFFVVCCAICYVRTHQSPAHYRLWWVSFGLCLGAAVMIKPPAIAGFFATTMFAHHFVSRRDLPWKAMALGPVLALVVAAAIVAPWLLALYGEVGWIGPRTIFVFNSIERARADGPGAPNQSPWFYLDHARHSSRAFRYIVAGVSAAVAGFAVAVVTGRGRLAWGLPVLLATTYLTAISLSATKHFHYCYASFPFLSLTLAGVLLIGFGSPPASGRWVRIGWRGLGIAGVVTAAVLLWHDCLRVEKELRAGRWNYPPVLFREAMRPKIESGGVRLILYNFPAGSDPTTRDNGFSAADPYYCDFRLPGTFRPCTIGELNQQLADDTPTVVFLPPLVKLDQLMSEGLERIPDRCVMVHSQARPYPVLLFNGAEAACDLGGTIRPVFVNELEVPKRMPSTPTP